MNAEISPLIDVLVKLGFTFLGALVGASVTAFVNRSKLRRLAQASLRRIGEVAGESQKAFSTEEAARCVARLESSARVLEDFVASGLRGGDWVGGLALVDKTRQAAVDAASAPLAIAHDATSRLRSEGQSLAKWLDTIA